MSLSVTCPECTAKLKVGDDLAGEETECPRCGAEFTVPKSAAKAARKPAVDDDDDEERKPAPKKKPAPAAKRRSRDEDDDDDDDDEEERRPVRRRPRKKAPESNATVFVVIGVLLVVLIGAGVGIWAFTRKKPDTASNTTPPPIGVPGPVMPGGPPGGMPKGNAFSNNSGKIEGTRWSSLQGFVKGQNIPAGVLKFDFAANGGLVYDTPTGKFTGTYSLGNGDSVVLNLDQPLAGSRRHDQRVSINGDRMTVSDADGTSLSFEKVR